MKHIRVASTEQQESTDWRRVGGQLEDKCSDYSRSRVRAKIARHNSKGVQQFRRNMASVANDSTCLTLQNPAKAVRRIFRTPYRSKHAMDEQRFCFCRVKNQSQTALEERMKVSI